MSTKVIIKGAILIKNISPVHMSTLKKKLTFTNPKYAAAKKRRYIYLDSIPQHVFYYKERESSLIVPRGMLNLVLNLVKPTKENIKDHTVTPPIDLSFKGTLRDYQDEAVNDMLAYRYGIIEGATGSGKTVMGTAIAAERGLRTLVIVHNKELQDQWVAAFKQFTDIKAEDIGIIGGGAVQVNDVSIGIINSVAKHAGSLEKEFGLVIHDECHRCAGDSHALTINTLRPKYHVGLSATPFRSDGLTKVLFNIVGPIRHKVDRERLEDTGAVLVPTVIRKATRFSFDYQNDYAKLLASLVSDERRNHKIALDVIADYKKYKEPIMVVSDRIAHCEVIKGLIQDNAEIVPVVLSGRLSKEYRKSAVRDLRAGYYNILIATLPLLGEGFDSPSLNALFLITPIKFSGRLMQIIGRVLRPSKDGTMPRVHDYRDNLVPVLRGGANARDAVYRKHGWKVTNG